MGYDKNNLDILINDDHNLVDVNGAGDATSTR